MPKQLSVGLYQNPSQPNPVHEQIRHPVWNSAHPYLQLDPVIESLANPLLIVEGLQVLHVQFPETAVHALSRGLGDSGRTALPPLQLPVRPSLTTLWGVRSVVMFCKAFDMFHQLLG